MLDGPQNTSRIKTGEKVGQLSNYCTIKDPVDTKSRQGAVYSNPYHDYNKRYIGETKRSGSRETRQKEHKADIKNKRFDKSALTRHTFDLNHRMDWDNSKLLEFEPNPLRTPVYRILSHKYRQRHNE